MTTSESRLLGLVADAFDMMGSSQCARFLREAARSAGGEKPCAMEGCDETDDECSTGCRYLKVAPARPTRGIKMSDVRPGMRLRSLMVGSPHEIHVERITAEGFEYSHVPFSLGSRLGTTNGGEHYGYDGYAQYELIEEIDALNRVARPVEGEVAGSNPAAPGLDESRDCPDVVAQSGRAAQTGGPGSIPGDVRENASVGGEHAGPNSPTLQDASHVPPIDDEVEAVARAIAFAESREYILATSDDSELHHASSADWKEYTAQAVAAICAVRCRDERSVPSSSPSQEGRAGELRACPFCGSAAIEHAEIPLSEGIACPAHVQCQSCGAMAPATIWNCRPGEESKPVPSDDAIHESIEALTEWADQEPEITVYGGKLLTEAATNMRAMMAELSRLRTQAIGAQHVSLGAAGIYVASRASVPERSQMWRDLRAAGAPIISTWIDEAGEGETLDFAELWRRCSREIGAAQGVVLFAADGDFPLKGALIEVGIALGMGKPVHVVLQDVALEGRTMRPVGSWLKHPLVREFDTVEQAIKSLLNIRAPLEKPSGEAGDDITVPRETVQMILNSRAGDYVIASYSKRGEAAMRDLAARLQSTANQEGNVR